MTTGKTYANSALSTKAAKNEIISENDVAAEGTDGGGGETDPVGGGGG